MTRANVLHARGLETSRNELMRSEGSQKEAVNVNIDELGVITPRRGFNDYGNPTGDEEDITNSTNTKQIFEYKDRLFRHYSDKLEFEDELGNFQPITGSFMEVVSGLRLKSQEANSNLFFTTSSGIKKISVLNSSQLSSTSSPEIVNAGVAKATYIEGRVISNVGGFLPPQSKTAYRYLFGYKDNNDNLILGSPSFRYVVTNTNSDSNIPETSQVEIKDVSGGAGALAYGDYFIINTLNNKYTAYFSDGSTPEPKKSDTIGSAYIEINVSGLIGGASTTDVVAAVVANELSSVISEATISIDTLSTSIVVITSLEEGNIPDIQHGLLVVTTGFEASKVNDGETSTGSNANVELTLTIPQELTTEYFYQVYRTNYISTFDGLTLNDIDPGDELNLVYESNISSTDITNGEITFIDTQFESFRASSVPLYTNAITGEGILQANDRPPIAEDIELFRGSMFYANTVSPHYLALDIISIDDFLDGVTKIVVGNQNTTRYYTFSGGKEDVTITAGTLANTADGSYILIDSANNERQYYLWFAKTTSTSDPNLSGLIGIKVNIISAVDEQDIVDSIHTSLLDNIDFESETINDTFPSGSSVNANEIRILYTNNGDSIGARTATGDETVDIGTGWNITTNVEGYGEVTGTDEGGNILLSALVSTGQAIDETAKSLVKVINKDPDSPVNAFYLSTSDDLPGKIRFESRSQEDINFYISIDDPRNNPDSVDYDMNVPIIGEEFNPELPLSIPIERIVGLGLTTRIQVTNHGYSDGDEVFVGYFPDSSDPDSIDSFSNVYTIVFIDNDNFSIPVANLVSVDSSGANPFPVDTSTVFLPEIESTNDKAQNRLYYSKLNEPEAVPISNFINIGAKDAPIRRILALRDNLFVLKDDGVFVVSGTSAPDFTVRLLDNTKLLAPDSATVLNNQIYALTEQGISIITDSGVGTISRGIENLTDSLINSGYDYIRNTFGIAYENDRTYIMFAPSESTDISSTQAFRYHIFERTWTRWEYNATCGHVLERNNKLYLGNGNRNYVSQERKNGNRTDYADREFLRNIVDNAVDGVELRLSNVSSMQRSYAITQTQSVTIDYFNRVLLKMDVFDSGLTKPVGSTFLEEFEVFPGDNIVDNIQALNDYLVTLDAVNISAKTITTNNFKQEIDDLIDELNTADAVTNIKTYKKSVEVTFETYIQSIDFTTNTVTVNDERPFLEGEITVYEYIDKKIIWNPQHFGDPSTLKQVSYATIMFDQNNFNDAVARFGSDISQELTSINFKGKGIGYWGDLPWGDPNHYWGGDGNDIPFRTLVPRTKQKCRYLTLSFEHRNAREFFKIVGISADVRAISGRAYR